jgi:hypothetical protein
VYHPENGGDIFLRNINPFPNYKALRPSHRRKNLKSDKMTCLL